MICRTMEFESEDELIAAEQAIAMARELKKLADAAPDGHVLAVVEAAARERGRRFTRDRLQDALNAQAADLEKKRLCSESRPEGPSERRKPSVDLSVPSPTSGPTGDRSG